MSQKVCLSGYRLGLRRNVPGESPRSMVPIPVERNRIGSLIRGGSRQLFLFQYAVYLFARFVQSLLAEFYQFRGSLYLGRQRVDVEVVIVEFRQNRFDLAKGFGVTDFFLFHYP